MRRLALISLVFLLTAIGCHNKRTGGSVGSFSNAAALASLSLSASGLDQPFSPATTVYTATVASTATSTTVSAATADADDVLTINGGIVPSGMSSAPIALAEGTNKISILVTDAAGSGSSRYEITVTRLAMISNNSELSALSLSAGTLAPSFQTSLTNYALSVPVATDSTTVTATTVDSGASLSVDGQIVPSGQASQAISLALGITNIEVQVTAEDGVSSTIYSIEVTRTAVLSNNAKLSALSISAGSLDPGFTPTTTSYSARVGFSTNMTTVTATTEGANAQLTVNGSALASGTASPQINLAEGDNLILVMVTAEDGFTMLTYTIDIFRESMASFAQQGFLKASNADENDIFGSCVALSGDGSTLAIGSSKEDSATTGINGNPADDSSQDAGAVYVFTRDATDNWVQEAYIKASNTGPHDLFGEAIALSQSGDCMAIGARNEDSGSTGINGDQGDTLGFSNTGAVYVFARDAGGSWTQSAYIKASNTESDDNFGISLDLSDAGDLLAVGAEDEASSAMGINGDQSDNSIDDAGATYVFVRDASGSWSQEAYIKASNPGLSDRFGWRLALAGNGSTLAVAARREDSAATGIDGDQLDDSLNDAGAVYVFTRDPVGTWTQQAYVKASNTGLLDAFGQSLDLSRDGNTLAVGSMSEDSSAKGINGSQVSDRSRFVQAGAVYVFVRDAADAWSQQAYIKASNTEDSDFFGVNLAIEGDSLIVSALGEDSAARGLNGAQLSNSAPDSGAVYLFMRDASGVWTQDSYIKASNTGSIDRFGGLDTSPGLAIAGNTIAIAATGEDSGFNLGQGDNSVLNSGAVYVFK